MAKQVWRAGAATALAIVTLPGMALLARPATAQDAATIQAIQQQIQSLQTQLKRLQADAARRDAELKRAQDDAATARAQAAEARKAAMTPPPAAIVAAAPPPPPSPPLPPGTFRLGGVTVTLGGFAAGEAVYRSRNEAGTINTTVGAIPLPNSPSYHIPEFRETAQQSRFSLLTQGRVDDANKLTSYMETDFLSAGSSSNSNQSSSYTLRLRQFFAQWDNSDYGLHVVGGQAYSLATLTGKGLLPRDEYTPLVIDSQPVLGFDWARQAQFRVVKDFDDHRFSAGLSVEAPQTLFGSSAGNNCLTGATAGTAAGGGLLEYSQCGGPNVNTIQSYSDNAAPDIIAKVAADPGFGHYEVYGLLRFLDGRVSFPAGATGGVPGTGKSYDATGLGVGGGMILPLVPKTLNFLVSGLFGKGIGRYGSGQLADATFNAAGRIEPLTEYSIMGGFVGHPIPPVDVYAYVGAEGVDRKAYGANAGYGNPNVNLSGCTFETGSCSANSAALIEGTLGAWWKFYKGSYGTMQAGVQYEYDKRSTFAGASAAKGSAGKVAGPTTDENALLVSFRYYPFSNN